MPSTTTAAKPSGAPSPQDLFALVKKLAFDLTGDDLELPGFPDLVVKLQRTLADQNAAVKDIVRIVTAEPALAARMIQLANSAAFNATNRQVSDLRNAITMLGFNLVRSTATTFAMRQLEQQEWLKPLRPHLARLWQDSVTVAATCFVVAKKVPGLKPDEALITGLFHQLGSLYVLTRAHKQGVPIGSEAEWSAAIASWHPPIARAILENWRMPAELGAAVEQQDGLSDADAGALALLPRLLAAAKLERTAARGGEDASDAAATLASVKFGNDRFLELVAGSRDEIETVKKVIGQ